MASSRPRAVMQREEGMEGQSSWAATGRMRLGGLEGLPVQAWAMHAIQMGIQVVIQVGMHYMHYMHPPPSSGRCFVTYKVSETIVPSSSSSPPASRR